jgi:DNA repair protein RecN (Recombination protein N)
MLRTLSIRNYALIDELHAEFSGGLVIITGETGAGKSIIIDALSLILGDRASSEVVRRGTEKAVVEAVFDVTGNAKVKTLLQENELDVADELIARREISARGQSRCFLNDSPVTLNLLKQTGQLLVDLHGQHEHQSLLRVETHIGMLDEFGGLDRMVAEFQAALKTLREGLARLHDLQDRESHLRDKREFYLFQAKEIDAVNPQRDEEERLTTDLRILENAETLFGATTEVYQNLHEGDRSVRDLLVIARNQLHTLAAIDPRFAEAAHECASAEAIVSELAKFVQSYNAGVEFSPERLEEIRDRLGRISLLKRKYGGSLESVIVHRQKIASELSLADNFEEVTESIRNEVASARKQCALIAERLSTKRNDIARKIDKAIIQELARLGILHARFSTRITQEEVASGASIDNDECVQVGRKVIRLNACGYDDVEFYISTNLGEDELPLVKVASGGEVSRIMLALKSILAKSDRLPVLIFDEIDVGVSGRIAQAVGASLKSLSGFHQVIAITHLPQIAGFADVHFAVEKEETKGRAHTVLRKLTLDEQVREVAKLMSGAEVTEAGLAGARELMGMK